MGDTSQGAGSPDRQPLPALPFSRRARRVILGCAITVVSMALVATAVATILSLGSSSPPERQAATAIQRPAGGAGARTATTGPPTTARPAPPTTTPAPTTVPGAVQGACTRDPEGRCYTAGEYCPASLEGRTIQGPDGPLQCQHVDGWRFEHTLKIDP